MDAGTLLLLLLILACPLSMLLMHRGGHGQHSAHGHAHDGGHAGHGPDDGAHCDDASVDELRRRRVALDAEIARLERKEEPVAR